jgi:hypothetical protein
MANFVYCCNDRQMGCRVISLSRRKICRDDDGACHFHHWCGRVASQNADEILLGLHSSLLFALATLCFF